MKILFSYLKNIDVKYFVLFVILYFIIMGNAACGCFRTNKTTKQSSCQRHQLTMNDNSQAKREETSNSILYRTKQPLPVSPNEMFMFKSTAFKPKCCPNTYSTSDGCACMTTEQYNYLRTRGQENTSFPEY